MNDNNRFFGMFSLCMKAGKLAPGEGKAESAVRAGKAFLVIVSADASDNTKKKFSDMASYRRIPIVFTADRYTIGRAIGRAETVTAAVTDKGLAERLISLSDCDIHGC